MFDPIKLREILELHERSFALLRWVRSALKQGRVSFSIVHRNTDSASAASEWIQRTFSNIPHEARPGVDQIAVFARLSVSFLATSYRLTPNAIRLESNCGCRCSYCAYLQAGPGLQARTPSKKDGIAATELKRIYLKNLAADFDVAETRNRVDAILETDQLSEDISIATWGAELLRRSEFASQGEAVLALWRQFAWHNNKPRQKFTLTVSRILAAEQNIIAAMNIT